MTVSPWRIVLGTAGAIALCWYAAKNPRDPQLFQIEADPAAYVGATVKLYVEARIAEIRPEGFLLRQGDRTILVRGTFPELIPGNQVAVSGVYQEDGSLRVSTWGAADPAPRELRKWISVAGILLVLAGLVRNLRLSAGGLEMKTLA